MWSLVAAEIAGLRAQNQMRRINHFDTERFIDNKWMRCALSFGELGIDDEYDFGPERAAEDASTLGRIVVTITRGSSVDDGNPELLEPYECPEDIQFASRALVEDHHITHALKVVPVVECEQPIIEWEFTPARGPAGRPEELAISYRSQEALELLGVVFKREDDVKEEPEDRKDPAIKAEVPLVMPKLEAEQTINIGDGASFPETKKKRAVKQEQDVAVSGNKRKRTAPTNSTSTSKKVKREKSSVDPGLEQEGPSSRTRSKARAEAQVSDAAAVSKAPAKPTKTTSRQQDDNNDNEEVEFISSRPVHRVVGRYVIDE